MRPQLSLGSTIFERETMPESTTTNAAVNKAAKAAGVSAAAVSEALPTVVETVEVAMQVPAKVVLNQRLVVATAIVGGTALGAGLLYGYQKLKARKAAKEIEKAVDDAYISTDN